MTVIAFAGASLLDRVGASRAALAAPPGASVAKVAQGVAAPTATRVSLGSGEGGGPVYGDPRTAAFAGRSWASPPSPGDTISALMARNRGLSLYNLGDQWRGLGGALLSRFSETGTGYSQAVADDLRFTADDRFDAPADIATRQAEALADIPRNAATVGLKIRTRAGETLELAIAVNSAAHGVAGLKVELKASGTVGAAERAAVGRLAQGLNRALEGLGRGEALDLDLSGLLGYDRTAIGSIDLAVDNPQDGQALRSFSLRLGDDRKAVSLKGSDGDMTLNVDAQAPAGGSALRRQAALLQTLSRMDGAGQRAHANAALVEQMKSAFEQLQAASAEADDEAADTAQAAPLSGLADFQASFGGDTWRSNRYGAHNEAGHMAYQLSQATTTRATANGAQAPVQVVSEQLDADFRKAPGEGMLDVSTGNYTATHIRDSSTETLRVEPAAHGTTRALRKTEARQLKVVTEFENGRVTHRQSWPGQRNLVERLPS